MISSTAPTCAMCDRPIAYRGAGRRPKYCTKSCRQAVYRANGKAREKAAKAVMTRRMLGELAHQLRGNIAELTTMISSLQHADRKDTLPTGWETAATVLADQLAEMARSAALLTREHVRLADEHRQSIEIVQKANGHDGSAEESSDIAVEYIQRQQGRQQPPV
ncbi:hypothetical protein [Actinomadura sp. 9N215]|uniref:hypothetical protein n=1 Tax=Actinomadura sp. 9N215 TaxID=3375150 RepID=UPI0037926D7A